MKTTLGFLLVAGWAGLCAASMLHPAVQPVYRFASSVVAAMAVTWIFFRLATPPRVVMPRRPPVAVAPSEESLDL